MADIEQKVSSLHAERMERMTAAHYDELISLLHEKILRLEKLNDEKRREINRLKRELKAAENRREPQIKEG